MTDATLATGDFSSVEIISNDLIDDGSAAVAAAPVEEALNGFVALDLAPELIRAVKDLGFTQPTIVQQKTIPLALQGHNDGAKEARFIDLMVSSQTGSGKTAAFLLPVLHTLLTQQAQAEAKERDDYQRAVAEATAKGEAPPKRAKRKDPTNPRHFTAPAPGALVVCPTRELAQQVAHDAIDLVQHCRGLRIANIVGGMPYQLQIAKLQNANLVVATPGRLLDLQRSMQIKLDQVQFLVVDEADRMLDLGFADDLAEINQLTIARKQTMMFSATFAPRIQQLAARVMREPQRITIDNPQEKHANIKQVMFWADNAQHKRKLLDHWLRDTGINQAIVFASTQIECDGLANDLQQDGFDAVALHGALSQGLRNRRLMALRQGQVQILVATDVAARGLDVPTITHVFNFGLPMKAEDYTHRIGRTGRAGRDGLAVTFAEFRDRRKIFDIEAYTRQPIKAEVVPGLEPQQRMPEAPRGGFGGRGGFGDRDRKFGGGGRPSGGFGGGNRGGFGDRGGFNDNRGGFADRNASGPRLVGADSYQDNKPGGFHPRDERPAAPARDAFSYERKGGFNDRFAGDRNDRGPGAGAGAPRGDFAARKPAFGKPAFSKPAGGGKVFVPRDAQKRFSKNDR
ncbi:MAG: DEAD/DEAH box helicase [Rhodoferax sp.]|uniref:DEAD/DEAH box helicase n=1 Tax=Rhodoferax sp. TaxID=50421 RepID=UPI001B5AFDD4|nr:DEAD/DEAH box helicase [Rhodoferax sp.]MBP9904337.1 DEAD/DEAH box helicase [Rhodoferax sp.]